MRSDLTVPKDKSGTPTVELSMWHPNDEEREILSDVKAKFILGYETSQKPRVEFNDLSLVNRAEQDTLAFNTYQPNNGEPYAGDSVNGWRSTAIRPIERNKAISIAAHATARTIFPKVFATDEGSNLQEDAAQVIKDLMEWTGEKYGYAWTCLQAVMQALVEPASIVHTEYVETYRQVKRPNDNGGYSLEEIRDEDLSGFRDTIVPSEALYIENFFEPDIQKQGWLIWRRVQDHRMMETKYGHLPNFKYVKKGMQLLLNDANNSFYYVYDPNMRDYMDEEVIYYEKSRDLMLIFVNGVLLTKPDNANPREDKLYPFTKFGYEFIRASQCFYYKSLVNKITNDANIVNSLYAMVVDGTYLNMMPPMFNQGGEMISADVIVPGRVTTFSSPDAQLVPLKVATDLRAGLETMVKVEESVAQSSETPVAPENSGNQTAYEVSKREQERNTILGLFVQMIGSFVTQYGRLRLGDILQHLTVAEANTITDNPELVYKSFLVNKKETGKQRYRKIKMEAGVGENASALEESYKTLKEQGGSDAEVELYRVNPEKIRDLKYTIVVSPDVLNPRSEEVERLFDLETYDRAIQNPLMDQSEVTKTFLLSNNHKSARNPDKFLTKQNQMDPMQAMMGQIQGAPPPSMPAMAAPQAPAIPNMAR